MAKENEEREAGIESLAPKLVGKIQQDFGPHEGAGRCAAFSGISQEDEGWVGLKAAVLRTSLDRAFVRFLRFLWCLVFSNFRAFNAPGLLQHPLAVLFFKLKGIPLPGRDAVFFAPHAGSAHEAFPLAAKIDIDV